MLGALLLWGGMTLQAQEEKTENVLFQHWAIGVNAGTNGFGFDVATTISPTIEARVGWDAMPRFTTTTHLYTNEITGYNAPLLENMEEKLDFAARSNMKTAKVLVDLFLSRTSNFHFTFGMVYCTNEKVAQATNTNKIEEMKAVHEWNEANPQDKIGVVMGDYFLEPDANGKVHAAFNVSRYQPYLGIGWGRSVPKKGRLGYSVDLGIKYWGKPRITCNDYLVTESYMNGSQHKVLRTLSNLQVYPVVNFRLTGRLF